jgi:hypothetical protein
MPPVAALGKTPLDEPHRARQRHLRRAQNEVAVVRHHAPREHRESILTLDLAQKIQEPPRLTRLR